MTKNTRHLTVSRHILFWMTCLFSWSVLAQSDSKLNKGTWYKISTSKKGVYRVDYNFLVNTLKVPAAELDFKKIGLFGYGGGVLSEDNSYSFIKDLPENAIEIVDKNGNDMLEEGDYFLFYSAGPIKWEYNPAGNFFSHTSPYYSELQHFFISTTEGGKKQMNSVNSSGSSTRTLNTYDYYHTADKDSFNPELSGRIWYANYLTNFNKSFDMELPIESCSSGEYVLVTLSYYSKISSVPLYVSVNGSVVKTINLTSKSIFQKDTFRILCPSSSSKINFSVTNTISDNFYIDYIEVNGKNALSYQGRQLAFRFKDNFSTTNPIQFNLSNAGNAKIWDVTKNYEPSKVNASGSSTKSYTFDNFSLREFIAFEDKDAYTPNSVGKISNQNLHGLKASDNIIVASKAWLLQARDLADFHKQERGIETNVVDIEEVYNEYSSGNKDVMAIRRFVKEQYEKAIPAKLSTLTLFGKACVDYKGINQLSNVCQDFVPTYETMHSSDFLESFCTDDFYGMLSISDTNLSDVVKNLSIGVGRLPVSNVEEARQTVAKIKAYKAKESYGDWRNVTTNVSDDYDDPVDGSFYVQNEQVLSKFIKDNNIKTNQNKIYLDAFFQEQYSGGQRYEDAEKMLKDNFTFGSLLITYIGHGGSANWAQERVLSTSDLPIYKNLNSLPFLTTATCGFAPYDKPNASNKSAGERFLLQKDGGAIGLMTTCREVLIADQQSFMDNFIHNFYTRKSDGSFYTLGDIAKQTKDANGMSLNSQKVVLLGDPALEINMPKYNVVTTSIFNGTDDTLKSLSKVKISGLIQNLNNETMTNFNGFCQVTVFDKKTMNKLNYNDTKDPVLPKDTFETQTSRIFKGSAIVTNGTFSIEFIVPKDINYAIGRGKISYYAADVSQKPYRDASGMDTNVWIGGANLNAAQDEDNPVVKLFMNDEKFVFGGVTNADPILLAKISDKSGINTTGAGVGHDITAILDGNVRIPVILNNYYKTEQGDFTQGKINYPYYQLADGKHSIKVKAWDVYNNPGEGYIEFVVAKSPALALEHVLNYPNPFTTNTYFQFEHNRPNELLDVTINVMTVSGRVVKRIAQKLSTDGYRVDKQIQWNGLDDFGDKIGKGVYIYVVTIRDSKGETAHKYEKLVLLQ